MLRVCANPSFTAQACKQSKKLFQDSSRRIYSSTSLQSTRNVAKTNHHWQAPLLGTLVFCTWWQIFTPPLKSTRVTKCEAQMLSSPLPEPPKIVVKVDETDLWNKVKRILRMIRRMIKLTIALSPMVALYPLQLLLHSRSDDDEDARDIVHMSLLEQNEIPDGPIGWYYKMCLHCVEWSGAACIKIMQWASSRPDIFGPVFCTVFSRLQDDTTPHAWKDTEKALREAYGEDWTKHIRLDDILGSGCIAQVYKGAIFDSDGIEQEVAVKVMHPNVEQDIDADLDLMRLSIRLLDMLPFDVFRNLKWLNLPGFVDEMDTMLNTQLDLRTEAKNLVQFNENFKDNDIIVFPKLVEGYQPHREVLVETFCEGVPVLEFVRKNTADKALLTRMCHGAIQAVCQMVFLDNFLHGDLHPGNVLISPDLKFVVLDVGIVTEHSEEDHRLLSDVLTAFIRMDGRKAGRKMMEDSNSKLRGVGGDRAVDEELYIDKIEHLTIKACGKGYLMEHLGTYITHICNAAAAHHVMLNQAFISAALAVKVQEGIALALDPSVEIWRVAIPIILEGERRHGLTRQRAKELLGIEKIVDWFTGDRNSNSNSNSKERTKM